MEGFSTTDNPTFDIITPGMGPFLPSFPREEARAEGEDSVRVKESRTSMEPLKFTEYFKELFQMAVRMYRRTDSSQVLLLLEGSVDWNRLKKLAKDTPVLVAASEEENLQGAEEHGFSSVLLNMGIESPVYDRLTQSILEAVADDLLPPGSRVVAIYSGFDPNLLDSISVINLGEHLDRLTGRDLRKLETRVPLKSLKLVVDLAVQIGREGREGKSVGALFVVGDSRKVLSMSKPAGFDPVRGYQRKERNLADARVREGMKEVAQLDGAFIISADATVMASCRYLDTSTATITLSKGLGARHWAAAAVSRSTRAVAIAVSQSNGTVRIFQNGECVLRIESRHRRPMVWREFEFEPPGFEQS